MTRDFGAFGARLLPILCVLLIGLVAVGYGTALAGDEDGVNGYSIRLKQKNFSSDDDGGASGLILVPSTKAIDDTKPMLNSSRTATFRSYAVALLRNSTWFVLLTR